MLVKKRNWVFVGYPESLPTNWKDILIETGLPVCVSPLHNKDINADKTLKKEHYHFIICYSGPTSYNVVSNLTNKLNATVPQPLEQVKGYYRYLTHKDNPEKYQYNEKDIIYLNGFSPTDYFDLSSSEVLKIKKELIDFINDNDIFEYCDFINYVISAFDNSYFDIASNNTYFFEKYITSARNKCYRKDL